MCSSSWCMLRRISQQLMIESSLKQWAETTLCSNYISCHLWFMHLYAVSKNADIEKWCFTGFMCLWCLWRAKYAARFHLSYYWTHLTVVWPCDNFLYLIACCCRNICACISTCNIIVLFHFGHIHIIFSDQEHLQGIYGLHSQIWPSFNPQDIWKRCK